MISGHPARRADVRFAGVTPAPPPSDATYRAKVLDMERVGRVFQSCEEAERADDQFYAALSPEERLDMLLVLIERHRSALGKVADRFERVHRITELASR